MVSKEQLNKLREILLEEYDATLSEEDLLDGAIRLSELARTIFRFKLAETETLPVKKK